MSTRRAIRIYRGSSSPAPVPIGVLFSENFNPQVGTYSDFGNGTHNITSGNMAIVGGNGFFTNGTILQDVVWNGNNWKMRIRYRCTNTNNGQFSACFGLISTNGAQAQPVAFGSYYFDGANNALLYIFNQNLNGGPVNPTQPPVTLGSNELVELTATFVESVLTVRVENLDTPDFVQDSYTYSYAFGTTQIKPNTGKIFCLSPQNTVNVELIEFSSDYLNGGGLSLYGDSNGSGYYQNSEAQRWVNQWMTDTGKQVKVFAGAGDRTIELSNLSALSLYTQIGSDNHLIDVGTNDEANGVPLLTILANYETIRTALNNSGVPDSKIYICTPLPRDGRNLLPLRAGILALTWGNKIDQYTHFEDQLNPGNMDPAYSAEPAGSCIHLNPTGATRKKNLVIASGIT